jgi:hypothetical protein
MIRIIALLLLTLTSCAAMEEDYRAQMCNREAAYEKGVNDANEQKPMDSRFASICAPDLQRAVREGYREGYEKSQNIAEFEGDEDGIRLKAPGIDIRMGNKGKTEKGWVCELKPFTEKFIGFGVTRARAEADARKLCEKEHHSMHCDQAQCKKDL